MTDDYLLDNANVRRKVEEDIEYITIGNEATENSRANGIQ